MIDAAAAGRSDGMRLALNIAAMLIAFIAFIALSTPAAGDDAGAVAGAIFSCVFSPVAVLMGVEAARVRRVAELLGTKLVLNEFVAYSESQGDDGSKANS